MTTRTTAVTSPTQTPGGGRAAVGRPPGGTAWQQLHEAIAATALTVLANGGYGAFSREAVARAGGYRRPTVGGHYPSNLSLAAEAIRQLPHGSTWLPKARTPYAQLRAAVHSAFGSHAPTAKVIATVYVNREREPELLAVLRDHVLDPRRKVLTDWLANGVRAGWARRQASPWLVESIVDGAQVTLGVDPATGLTHTHADTLALAAWRVIAKNPDKR